MYLIHNITGSQGGTVLGVFDNYKVAKKQLCNAMGWSVRDTATDWGHFIRILEPNTYFTSPLTLQRSNEEVE